MCVCVSIYVGFLWHFYVKLIPMNGFEFQVVNYWYIIVVIVLGVCTLAFAAYVISAFLRFVILCTYALS